MSDDSLVIRDLSRELAQLGNRLDLQGLTIDSILGRIERLERRFESFLEANEMWDGT